jgi:hypothetical protein
MIQNFQDSTGKLIEYEFQSNKDSFTCFVKQHGEWLSMAVGKTIEAALMATMNKWDNAGATA